MDVAFRKMNQSLSRNLDCVNKHIEALNEGQNVIDQQPTLEPLTMHTDQLAANLKEQLMKLTLSKKVEKALESGIKSKLFNIEGSSQEKGKGKVNDVVEDELNIVDQENRRLQDK